MGLTFLRVSTDLAKDTAYYTKKRHYVAIVS